MATRSVTDVDSTQMALQKWLAGPTYLIEEEFQITGSNSFPFEHPDEDVEIHPEVIVKATKLKSALPAHSVIDSAERFSTWNSFMRAIPTLIHVARTFTGLTMCTGWHICRENSAPYLQQEAEQFILSVLQKKHYLDEISALQNNRPIPKNTNTIPGR